MYRDPNKKDTLLVVDDNAPFRRLIAAWLYQAGYDVIQAEHGQEALEQLVQQPVDAVIIDLQMEPLGGFHFRDALVDTKFEKIPCILVTADSSSDVLMRASRAGFAGVMKKPVEKERLLQLVAMRLSRRPAMEKQAA
jgi:CheY-like chemotaxis protein